ncbi:MULTISPECIES: oxygenase MpaB family protein [unclassified Halomonas]|uniref:oxygenase MpaB family protein n=1 Tax=unclassified Halomonas TaxID=2609666 RepID=UPI0020A00329|nr:MULTISPECIES: oxygenase MpaB family protein [unclassified Halomonas]MCP1313119.1 oxygenase MpaB family protein [Halomonas sp. 707D7]MCP1325947.1 oxygenase MpaB family protein [Halomonas sp. 707D4]
MATFLRDAMTARLGRARVERHPGPFPKDELVRNLHGDFTPMMCGGISALLLQMLHPLALAGVWDHSHFRHDMVGRLRRTSDFIATTSFGTFDEAEAAIERVRRVHARVRGKTANGEPYAADDPALLTWVHVAEMSRFMAAHLRYRNPGLSRAEQDRYFFETACIAEALGARDVPDSAAAIDAYLEAQRPRLVCDTRTREVVALLLAAPPRHLLLRPAGALFMRAGIDLLPEWAAAQLDLAMTMPTRRLVRAGIKSAMPMISRAVRSGAYRRALARYQAPS